MIKYSLFLFFFTSLYSTQYLISYKSAVKNAVLINEELSVSKAMTKCEGSVGKKLLLNHVDKDSLKETISKNQELFYSYVQKLPFSIRSYETIDIHHINSLLILKLYPQCFTVNFNEGFVTIAPINNGGM